MDVSERKWLERGLRDAVLSGDEAAWKALYDSCFDRLWAYIYYRAQRNTHRAEEAIQETWLVAVRRIRRFDPDRGTFEQWLHGIAENVLRNEGRRWWRRARTETSGEVDAAAATQRPVALVELVALVMTGLPAQYQAVLRAKYEAQLPVAEIAQRWNVSPKAVESLLSRARAAFRQDYERLDQEGLSKE